jgi:CRP/FNR family transcriptional regulator
MTPSAVRRLSEFDLLEGVDAAELERRASLRVFERGRFLYLSHDDAEAVYFLASGMVKVSRLSDGGKELTLDIVGSGQPLGLTEVLCARPRENVAEVLERAAVWVVPATSFRSLLMKTPEVSLKLLELIAQRQSQLERRVLNVAYEKAPRRLADMLLHLGESFGVRDARGIFLPLRISQSALGNLLGMSREMVNITMSEMKRRGVIALAGGRFVIRNPQALAQERHPKELVP